MRTCDQCRELLWDELYGLLEPVESQALAEHLAGCPDCGAELAKARAEQQLVAAAARLEIIIPSFVAPAGDSQPAMVRFDSTRPAQDFRHRSWPWLAAAAAILLSIVFPQSI